MLFAFIACALLPLLGHSQAPTWWEQHGVTVSNAPLADYAPVNQGQLKNIATAAIAELAANLAGGAGDTLNALADSCSPPNEQTNDFAPVNLGQLKQVAAPFYDRMIVAGIVDRYPWLGSLEPADDFAVANIGQLKNLFSFRVPLANALDNPLGDRIAAGPFSANLALELYAVWTWDDHFGNGSDFERNLPHRVNSLGSISSVSAGERHLVALRSDGTAVTWGENGTGQLGDGTSTNRFTPGIVPNLTNIASVKAGGLHTLALRQDGTLLAWGDNYYGQLGNGDRNSSSVPVLVPALDNVQKIAAGYQRSIALRADGTVWAWGYEHYSGGDIFSSSPVLVPALADVSDIAAGYEHAVALKGDGTVWVWGSNYSNQLGNGSPFFIYQATPVQVPNLQDIIKVASAYDHTLALANDGRLWAWGNNYSGQLGDGTNQARSMPVQVIGLTDIVAIATAYSYSLAMKADGTVWAWGEGAVGTLPGTDPYVPQLVCLGLLDTNHNQMDDRWEMHFLGNLNQTGDTDYDGDGISNLQEYFRGTDPTDYFNGVAPIIEIASGNNQVGDPGAFLGRPFTVRVRNAAGQLLVNAPVTFSISTGGGRLSATAGGSQQQNVSVRTASTGQASVYHVLPQAAGTSTRTIATAGPQGAAMATFRGVVRYSPPSSPTPPPPPPGGSPTPSPTATPAPPYRYAVLDLGKNLYPIRVNNRGWILLQGEDADGNWGYYRWKGGVMERLTFSEPYSDLYLKDMNDAGVVVGYFERASSWINNQVNEVRGGLIWDATSVSATKVSAQTAVRKFEPQNPGTFKYALLNVITNSNNPTDLYGHVCTGTVRGFLNRTIMVLNSQRWATDSTPPVQLSNASAVNSPPDSDISVWQGSSDTISRANSARHYIGTKFTPDATNRFVLRGTTSGMIDGASVSFNPVDINEAGIVVGNSLSGGSMVIRMPKPTPTPPAPPPSGNPEFTETIIAGASPLVINNHKWIAGPSSPGPSPGPTATPTPIPAPQILGWSPDAAVIWELQNDGHTWHPFGLEEMIPSMDGWDYLGPYGMNDNGIIVGDGWFADPTIPNAESERHAFMLVPVELMVDGNRDGEMSFDDPIVHGNDQTSEEKPYRFWINNDSDGILDGEEIEGGSPDYADSYLKSLRDLEDFSRLWISFKGVTEILKNGGVTVQLEWKPISGGAVWPADAGDPAINVFKAVEPSGGNKYLSDETTAKAQVSYGNTPTEYSGSLGRVGRGQPVTLPAGLFSALDQSHHDAFFLFEGAGEGKGQLVVSLHKGGQKLAECPGLHLNLTDVRKMYERAKATPFVLTKPQDSTITPSIPPISWISDPNGKQWEYSPVSWVESKEYVIAVHGWNVTYNNARAYFADTTFKRLWQRGYRGRVAAIYWPTLTGIDSFNESEYRAWVFGESLKQYVSSLPGGYSKNVIAHSMGNTVVGSALRKGMTVGRYALINAAVPAACYDDRPSLYKSFGSNSPDHDADPATLALAYKSKLSGIVGNLINFYLASDDALDLWRINQEAFRPEFFHAISGGDHAYKYFPGNPSGTKLFLTFVLSPHRNLVQPEESFAFAAKSSTLAAGAEGNTAGAIDVPVNLASFGYQNEHSAPWSFTLQKMHAFYARLMDELEIQRNP